ncbi:MAG: hypothetical protein A2Y53_04875 [Chloroflexi bacterium RBG_16_47_49]|nr:MAG: hypothetical protein A2Y53_04875 [Chloroflexi bacterium RBG_16_47_49]
MTSLFFDADDLTGMRSTQDGHMQDECVTQARVQTADTYNQLIDTYPVDSAAIICGLDMRPGIERHMPDGNTVTYDATIRLPIATVVLTTDRIKITKRFGETLAVPLVYEIMSPIQRGPSGLRYALRRLEL